MAESEKPKCFVCGDSYVRYVDFFGDGWCEKHYETVYWGRDAGH